MHVLHSAHTLLSLLLWPCRVRVSLLRVLPRHLLLCSCAWQIRSACWTELLPLEPRAETGGVEDVPTWEPLALVDHLLTTDDANVVNSLQFLWGDIWVTGGRGREGGGSGRSVTQSRAEHIWSVGGWGLHIVQVVYSSSRHDDILNALFELPTRLICRCSMHQCSETPARTWHWVERDSRW